MKRHTSWLLLLGVLATCACASLAGRAAWAAEAKLNLYAWQQLPVMHHGRVMPLQSYARSAAEIVTGKENPTFNVAHEVPAKDLQSDAYASVRMLFPDGSRKFEASELMLSWLAEPDAWDRVPFILAEHEKLRELLKLDLVNADKERLRYVSPYELADSDEFMNYLRDLQDKDKQARAEGREFKAEGLDKLVADLWNSFKLYRQLTTDPMTNLRARSRFMDKASATLKDWASLSEPTNLGMLRGGAATEELGKLMSQLDAAQESIIKTAGAGEFAIAEIEPAVDQFARGASALHKNVGELKQKMFDDRSRVLDDKQRAFGKEMFTRVTSRAKVMARNALEMQLALYDDGESIRVVPALNSSALEKDRDVMVDSQPWLSLRTVLVGSKLVLAPYPAPAIAKVRSTYNDMVAAYTDRSNSDRAGAFERTSQEFSAAMRSLGEQIEPLRAELLPKDLVDADLMAHTRYPDPSVTAVEVRYNNVNPFTWSWVISLFAVMAFCVSFGAVRKPMFWVAMGLLGLCIAWTIYGFFLRVSITHWAPVTNMYETVIYVPLFVSALGAWFVMTPLVWNGLRAAWRATALPFGWEAGPLTEDQTRMMSASGWNTVNLAMVLPRVALMAGVYWLLTQADFYDGGNTVLSLSPKVPLNQLALDFNALAVWVISLLVVAASVWYLPRVLLTVASSLVMVPWSLYGRTAEAAEGVYARWPFGMSAACVALLGFLVASYAPLPGEDMGPLQPVLRSNFWLTIHVLTIVSSYAAGALAWMIGNMALAYYAFGKYREPVLTSAAPGYGPATSLTVDGVRMMARRPPEQTVVLANYAYKAVQVAVMLLAAGTILGGLWADVSWGRFWGWDPKEVFALVSLLIYLAILHGRYAGWFGNLAMAVGTVFGATAIIFSWYGVNFVLGVGLHSYGFGSGGQLEVGTAVLANWLFMIFAICRCVVESRFVPVTQDESHDVQIEVIDEPVGSAK